MSQPLWQYQFNFKCTFNEKDMSQPLWHHQFNFKCTFDKEFLTDY